MQQTEACFYTCGEISRPAKKLEAGGTITALPRARNRLGKYKLNIEHLQLGEGHSIKIYPIPGQGHDLRLAHPRGKRQHGYQ